MPLYVVATPIGNLEDLSPRAQRVLSEASLVLCEDTRHSRKLYSALQMSAPELWSCHAHNELGRLPQVLERLAAGLDVALISDAGTPGISDPGGRLVEAVHQAGHPVVSVPGPSAIVTALSVSGFPATPFHMLGFPPRKAGPLRQWLHRALSSKETLVILESGKRAGRLIRVLAELTPEREAVICRELTKVHEEIRRGLARELSLDPMKGELVLVVGPGDAPPAEAREEVVGEGLKAVAAILATRWGCTRREAYQRLIELESSED